MTLFPLFSPLSESLTVLVVLVFGAMVMPLPSNFISLTVLPAASFVVEVTESKFTSALVE